MILNVQELRGRSKNIIGIIGVVVGFAVVGGVVASTFMRDGKTPERVEYAERVGKVEEPEAIDPPKEIKASSDAYASSVQQRFEAEERPAQERQLLSREELLQANWRISWDDFVSTEWRRFGDYEIRYVQPLRGYTKEIVVRKADSSQEVVAEYTTEIFTSLVSPKEGYGRQGHGIATIDILLNKKTEQLYALVEYGAVYDAWGRLVFLGGDIFQSDIFGNDPKYLGENAGRDSGMSQYWRFSPDGTTLSYVTAEYGWDLESEEGTGAITFHIIDLLDTERSVHFVLSNVDKHKLYAYRKNDYWVSTWQFIGGEVVEYTVERDDLENRMSGGRFKELWRYDKNTGESTLIETISFFPP